jgi:VCBS repeat-containing protein
VLADLFTLNETDGTISYDRAAFDYLAAGEHVSATFTFDASSGPDTVQKSLTVTIDGANDAPTIGTSGFQIAQSGGTTTISNLSVLDPDTSDTFTLAVTADHGSAAVSPTSGVLTDINGALTTGITYTPTGTPATDKIALTVTDATGAHDTVNFIFNVAGTGPVTLQGTSERDVFFATGYQDTFVFAPSSNHDIITGGFQSGIDKIDLQALTSINATALTALLNTADHTGGDTLLYINGNTDTLLLKGVATLNASDFILSA